MSFKNIEPYYAVKANSNTKILSLLHKLDSCFDCASLNEVMKCVKLKVNPQKISFGNTVKKTGEIKKAFKLGINLFAFDSYEELLKIAKFAPKSNVFCRLQVSNGGAEWPLSKKFGCKPKELEKLCF